MLFSQRGNSLQIMQHHCWVYRRLREYELGVFLDLIFNVVDICHINVVNLYPIHRLRVKEGVSTKRGVDILAHDDMISFFDNMK